MKKKTIRLSVKVSAATDRGIYYHAKKAGTNKSAWINDLIEKYLKIGTRIRNRSK